MRWRRIACIGALCIGAVFVYQTVYLSVATAKLLGYGLAFQLWCGPVERVTTHVGAVTTDVYSGRKSHFPLILVHGVNESGKDSPVLKSLAEMLAGAGYRVFVPEFRRMAHQNVTPQDIDDVSLIFRSIGSDAGILCASYGCGPALIAASRPDIRDRVRFIVTYGAYFDLAGTLRSIVTSPPSALAYSKWVYLAANADLIATAMDRMSLIEIARERSELPPEEWSPVPESLGTESRAMLALFESESPEQFDIRLNAVPLLRDRIERLSPSRYFAGIKAPLVIVHMESDPSIPSIESLRMAETARKLGIPYSFTILNMHGHTTPLWPALGIRNLFGFYLPESAKAILVVREILRYT